MRRSPIVFAISLAAVFVLLARHQLSDREPERPRSIARTYTTTFPFLESPISECGHWLNGAADGLEWGNVATRAGLAYGLQDGSIHYADGTAILSGFWWPDQTVEATVHIEVTRVEDYPEVELRLRSSLSPHTCTGYEVLWGVAAANPYFAIVRWNGALGDFTYLYDAKSAGYGSGRRYAVHDGDVVKATIVGNVITAYVNGVRKAQVTDSTFAAGNPGLGFNYCCGGDCTGPHDGYGFTRFSALAETANCP